MPKTPKPKKPTKLAGKRRSWPVPLTIPPTAGAPAVEELRLLVLTGEEHWTGGVVLPSRMKAKIIFGTAVIDLREALFPAEAVLDIDVILGQARVIVPPGVRVEFAAAESMGEAKDRRTPVALAPDAPRLLIVASSWLGELHLVDV